MSYKINIESGTRTFYVSPDGNDGESGLGPETALKTITEAIIKVNALSPVSSSANPTAIIGLGSGAYVETNLVFPEACQFSAPTSITIAVSGTGHSPGDLATHELTRAQSSVAAGAVYEFNNAINSIIRTGSIGAEGAGTIGVHLIGTSDTIVVDAATINCNGIGAIGILDVNTNTVPEIYRIGQILLQANDTIAFQHDPTDNISHSVIVIGSVDLEGAPTGTRGLYIKSGFVDCTVSNLEAADAITVENGATLNIHASSVHGNITVDVGGTLNCSITEHDSGTITNNGTINGTIKNTVYGDLTLVDKLLVPDGLFSAPSITFAGDTQMGLARSGSQLLFCAAGQSAHRLDGTLFRASNAAGYALNSANSTATVPSLIPNRNSTTTGIGAAASGEVSIITGATERVNIDGAGLATFTNDVSIGTSLFVNLIDPDTSTLTIDGTGVTGSNPHVVDIITPAAGGILQVGPTGNDPKLYLQVNTTECTVNSRANFPLLFKTNNIERMSIDAGGSVIISPSGNSITPSLGADDLIIENSVDAGLSILTPDINTSQINFGSPSTNSGAFLRWNFTANVFNIGTNNTGSETAFLSNANQEALRIDASRNVLIGTTSADGSAILQAESITKGFLMPRMTETQRDLIGTPATGLIIYNTTALAANIYNGTIWGTLDPFGGGVESITAGNNINNSGTATDPILNLDNVVIGTGTNGLLDLRGAQGGTIGGNINISAGFGTTTAGKINITAGATNATGEFITISGGDGPTGKSGGVNIFGGTSGDDDGEGGDILIRGGQGGVLTGAGGEVTILGGDTNASTVPGDIILQAGEQIGMSVFGDITMQSTGGNVTMGNDLTIGGQVLAKTGSAGSPSLAFSSDPDTGIYSSSGNEIGFATAGTQKFKITNTAFQGGVTSAGAIRNVNASATGPTLLPRKNSTTTGIGAAADGELSLIVGGIEALSIDSSGNIGIGTNVPSASLDVIGSFEVTGDSSVALTGTVDLPNGSEGVVGTGTFFTTEVLVGMSIKIGTQIRVVRQINSNTSLLVEGLSTEANVGVQAFIDGDILSVLNSAGIGIHMHGTGFLGISVLEPDVPLHLASSETGSVTLERYNDAAIQGVNIEFKRSKNATLGVHTALSTNDSIGILNFRASDGTDFDSVSAQIQAFAGENITGSAAAGFLTFSTTPVGTTNLTERMRITSEGVVTINNDLTVANSISSISLSVQGDSSVTISGTVDLPISSKSVVGTGTFFTTELLVGMSIKIGTQVHVIDLINTNTSLNVTVNATAGNVDVQAFIDGDVLSILNSAGTGIHMHGTGFLGIGEVEPEFPLHIASTSINSVSLDRYSTTAGQGAGIDFRRSNSDTLGTHAALTNNDAIGIINFRASDGTDFDHVSAQIKASAEETITGSSAAGRLVFSTTPSGSTNLVERIRIDSTGLVTIINNIDVVGELTAFGGGSVSSNLAIGAGALAGNSSGTLNVALGSNTLNLATGSRNVAIGADTLKICSTGERNVGLGDGIMQNITSGSRNVAVGSLSIVSGNASQNTAIGHGALNRPTVGNQVAIGYNALNALTSGSGNTAIGFQAMAFGTTQARSTALGQNVMNINQPGDDCTGLGYNALLVCTGDSNTAVGSSAGAAISTGTGNVAIGASTMDSLNTGINNVGIGLGALGGITNGSNNVGIGLNALSGGNGSFNVAIGQNALLANNGGGALTAVGQGALDSNTTGSNSVAFGTNALGSITTNDSCTAIGRSALVLATGAQNTGIGRNAGNAITTGANNICIGFDSETSAAGASNETVIGNASTTLCKLEGIITGNGSGLTNVTLGDGIYLGTAVSVSTSNEATIGVTSTAAARTITLSTADTVAGRTIVIKDESGAAGTNNITIATEASETIDGASTVAITVDYGNIRVYSNGTNWFTI